MSIVIYRAYIAQRKKDQEQKIVLTDKEQEEQEHKAKITMEYILEYLHEWKEEDDDNMNIDEKSFLHFTWWVQRRLWREEI